METNEVLREQIFKIVQNQLRDNKLRETHQTYIRLKSLGYTEYESKQLIGQCVSVEIYKVIKHQKPFDEIRYIKNLTALPKGPFK